MIQKRYITNKYVRCYCSKDEDILVGMKPYRFVNTFFLPLVVLGLCALIVILDASLLVKVVSVLGVILFFVLLSRSYYSHAEKEMLLGGHSEECSRKIAYLALLYAGLWSEFKIMKNKEN